MKRKNSKQDRTLTIILESFDAFAKRSLEISRKGARFIRPINEIVFDSASLYYRFMTPQKLEALSLIIQKHPDSIFHLAQLVNRDYASVLRDCRALETLKFIKFEDTQDNRKTRRPILSFDYTTIEVQLPTSTIVHKLDHPKAA